MKVNTNNVIFRKIEDEGVLLNLNNEIFYTMNEVGCIVWEQLVKGSNLSEIVCEVQKEYNLIDIEQIKDDIITYIKELQKEGMLIYDNED